MTRVSLSLLPLLIVVLLLFLPDQGSTKGQRPQQEETVQLLIKRGDKALEGKNYQLALELYTQAFSKVEDGDNPLLKGDLLYKMGRVHLRTHRYDSAISAFSKALPHLQQVKSDWGRAVVFSSLGSAEQQLGRTRIAREWHQKALTIRAKLKDKRGEIRSLINIGHTYFTRGRYSGALEYYQQALQKTETLKKKFGDLRANIYTHLGSLHGELGQLDSALSYYMKAKSAYTAIGSEKGIATSLHNRGYVLAEMKRHGEAIQSFNEALVLRKRLHDSYGRAQTLNSMGLTMAEMGDTGEALERLQEAEDILVELKTPGLLAATLDSSGSVHRLREEYQQSVDYYGRALEVYHSIDDWDGERTTLGNLAKTLAEKGQTDMAVIFYKMAVDISQRVRAELKGVGKALRKSYVKKVEALYRELIELLFKQGRLAEAEEVLTMLKEEEHFNFMQRRGGNEGSTAITFLPGEEKWIEEYTEEKGLAQLRQKRRAIRLFIAAMEEAFYEQGRNRMKEFGKKRIDQVDQLQHQLEKFEKKTALLHTFVTQEKLHLLLTTGGDQFLAESDITRGDLGLLVGRFRQSIQERRGDHLSIGRELYSHLIGPLDKILEDIEVEILMFSLDDSLRYVPIAALHDGTRYLCRRFGLVLYVAAGEKHLEEPPKDEWEVVALGVSESQDTDHSDLPAVKSELDSIVVEKHKDDKDGIYPGVVRLNDAFTLQQLRNDLAEGTYHVIHIASHFNFIPGNEFDSFLLLGNGKRLSLAQYHDEGLPLEIVDLLTLSACDTAYGERDATGREVESFGVISLRLGAKAVVATLWKVDDAATASFMTNFYTFRKEGFSKVEMLQKTQLSFLDESENGTNSPHRNVKPVGGSSQTTTITHDRYHPYYWAPFILMGNFL